MTIDEKIDLLITRLIEKADKFSWSDNGYGITETSGYRILVGTDATVKVLTVFDEEMIPTKDLNTTRNHALRVKLADTISYRLRQDRSELIDDILRQLEEL